MQNFAVERTDDTDCRHDVDIGYTDQWQLGVPEVTRRSKCEHKQICTHDGEKVISMLQGLGLQLRDDTIVECHV